MKYPQGARAEGYTRDARPFTPASSFFHISFEARYIATEVHNTISNVHSVQCLPHQSCIRYEYNTVIVRNLNILKTFLWNSPGFMREKLLRIAVPYNVLRALDLEVFHSALQESMNRLRNLEELIIIIGDCQDEE